MVVVATGRPVTVIVDDASADVATIDAADVIVTDAADAAETVALSSSIDAAESGEARQLIDESPAPLLLPFTYR